MSNVTHAKTWQDASLPHSGPVVSGMDPTQKRTGTVNAASDMLSKKFDLTNLATTLQRLFDTGGDQLVWGVGEPAALAPDGERRTRVDSEHEVNRPNAEIGPFAPTLPTVAAGAWLVVIDSAHNLVSTERIEQFRALVDSNPRTLLVALDGPESRLPSPIEAEMVDKGLAELSAATGLDQSPPLADGDLPQMLECVSDIKRRDRPTLLRVLATNAGVAPVVPPGEDAGAAIPAEERAISRSLQEIASAELARRAAVDRRISIAVARSDRHLLAPWSKLPDRVVQIDSTTPLLLQWSSALALEGGRPFVFLWLQDLLGAFGQLLQEVCLKRAPVTLVVRPHDRSHDDEIVSSAALSGFRQLPHLSVISPKDSIELAGALEWCGAQEDPVLVWLPAAFESDFPLTEATPFEQGRVETLSTGNHVTIIAWGPIVAAASLAAQCLSEHGIECTVVNCRFAQPLDREGIIQATRQTLVTVVLDDIEEAGGFSSWILDHLARAGIARPVTVIAANSRSYPHDRYDSHEQFAMRIVEHCRWLAEPLVEDFCESVAPKLPVEATDAVDQINWTIPVCLPVVGQYDDQGQILAQQFSPFIEHWVRGYSETGQRDLYLWRWCLHGLELTTLSCVSAELRRDLCDTKLLAVMYGVMLDDVADQGGQEAFLKELTKIISGDQSLDFARFSDSQRSYASFTRQLWAAFEERLRTYPAFEEYESLLAYDHLQILNTMAYSCMVNRRPELLNVQEHDMVLPHNMQMMSFATMDLMCSPAFDRCELGAVREVVWHAQSMGRIGNLVSTWQREIKDRDFTSGVFARAIREGDLTVDELRSAPAEVIEQAIRKGGHEAYFLRKWEMHRRYIEAGAARIRSVDIRALLAGLQRLIHMELGSRGLK